MTLFKNKCIKKELKKLNGALVAALRALSWGEGNQNSLYF